MFFLLVCLELFLFREITSQLLSLAAGDPRNHLSCAVHGRCSYPMTGHSPETWVNYWLCMDIYLVGGIPTPLKNDGVRQLGWWHSQLFLESHNPFMFQSPPTRYGSQKHGLNIDYVWIYIYGLYSPIMVELHKGHLHVFSKPSISPVISANPPVSPVRFGSKLACPTLDMYIHHKSNSYCTCTYCISINICMYIYI